MKIKYGIILFMPLTIFVYSALAQSTDLQSLIKDSKPSFYFTLFNDAQKKIYDKLSTTSKQRIIDAYTKKSEAEALRTLASTQSFSQSNPVTQSASPFLPGLTNFGSGQSNPVGSGAFGGDPTLSRDTNPLSSLISSFTGGNASQMQQRLSSMTTPPSSDQTPDSKTDDKDKSGTGEMKPLGTCPNSTGVTWAVTVPPGKMISRKCPNNIEDAKPLLKKALLESCQRIGKTIVVTEIVRKEEPWTGGPDKYGRTSGSRCNSDSGGALRSVHMTGGAVDISMKGLTPKERQTIFMTFRENKITGTICYRDYHVHLAMSGERGSEAPCPPEMTGILR